MTGEDAAAQLAEVETPAGVVDLAVARRNIGRAADYCRARGLRWRPHVKTHKSLEIARLQIGRGASGLAVATPREAEVMAAATDDLLVAHPPAHPSKVARLCALPRGVDVKVGLDSLAAMRPLCRAGHRAGRTFGILVEFDAGAGRTGVAGADEVVRLAEAAAALPGGRFDGVMFYPGHLRMARRDRAAPLARLADRLGGVLAALDDAGLPARIVSGGSTPALLDSHLLPGLTEVRPGTCVYNDRDIVTMGAAEPGHVAYSVLAAVISTAVPGQAVVDAGSKALAKEVLGSGLPGYGAVLDRPGVLVKAVNEEHGMLDLRGTEWRPSVGDLVRIVPNHVCASVNLQDRLWAVEPGAAAARPIELEARGRAARA